MSILVDQHTRLVVQGLTGREGGFHAGQMAAYGTKIVAGVTPGKGGTTHEGWPVFNTVADAVRATAANASVIFVPPPGGADAVMEAADAGLDDASDELDAHAVDEARRVGVDALGDRAIQSLDARGAERVVARGAEPQPFEGP